MKIATIVGARPQFIKAATLSRVIAAHQDEVVQEILIHTGQHYDPNMSDIFFEEMELPRPHHHLGIGSGLHGTMTGRMLEQIEQILIKEKPDWVLVYGDTNSTLAGALAASKLHLPLAHVEAGLRSFNKKMPEEINRILTDHCADLLFTPNEGASQQLVQENIPQEKISMVGDVMYEAALYYQHKAHQSSEILHKLKLLPKKYVLATIHRAENTDCLATIARIIDGLSLIAQTVPVVWPIHPRTKKVLAQHNLLERAEKNVMIVEPFGYLDMLQMETNAQAIVTDSGGVQKEAFFFRVPCLTLREQTEWTELVRHGFNRLVPIIPEKILKSYQEALTRAVTWNIPLYGNGDSASRILQKLMTK